ncbi:ABC transporter ATP-binding protein [Ammoniphilus sp. CFH 90114]|uniref:ABC transporter ATP-binding protein n=1 Tax=Ammoniphilus sp. CFH 90114 TaxID=2493665 RepID=UPI00100E46BB|nr:ABC transporter ATP-binding protein [Ammoniphilus sp. CFH 90114]RXT03813.1 ABC transporter ATP-binding protein [Ammoniphilus sp. CFH 90114]
MTQIVPFGAPILELKNLSICLQQGKHHQMLVHDVNFSIQPGETLALVGESGSGKSLTASAILGLLGNSLQVSGGHIVFQGENILAQTDKMRRQLRGKQIGFVFQDYQGSFTPFIKIGKQFLETIRTHRNVSAKEAKNQALDWLERVGLPAERVFNSYPFQLSGGQRQRAAIAAALMLRPTLLIADEATTALDVLTSETVLDLLDELQKETGCAVLMISHDLRQVLKRADTIAVMKEGRVVESGTATVIRNQATHPYTQTLLKSRPLLTEIHAQLLLEEELAGTGGRLA